MRLVANSKMDFILGSNLENFEHGKHQCEDVPHEHDQKYGQGILLNQRGVRKNQDIRGRIIITENPW